MSIGKSCTSNKEKLGRRGTIGGGRAAAISSIMKMSQYTWTKILRSMG